MEIETGPKKAESMMKFSDPWGVRGKGEKEVKDGSQIPVNQSILVVCLCMDGFFFSVLMNGT